MLVCAHGEVADFCKARDMVIIDTWHGELSDYHGFCRVLVTDCEMTEAEYYFLKGELLGMGVELISTRYTDNELMSHYLVYSGARRKAKHRGRREVADEALIQKILELRDVGMTIREIREAEGVCRPDGRKLSISTIQKYIKSKRS